MPLLISFPLLYTLLRQNPHTTSSHGGNSRCATLLVPVLLLRVSPLQRAVRLVAHEHGRPHKANDGLDCGGNSLGVVRYVGMSTRIDFALAIRSP